MKVIRRGVFETNSSSTHSITMCSKEEYDKWKSGELLMDCNDDVFISKEDVIQELKKDNKNLDMNFEDEEEINDLMYDNEFKTYEQYWDDIDNETYKSEYTTKNGEKIVAFGYFGYDG